MTPDELTDSEWREFQAIPDQGYSHRAWVDARIAERTTALLAEVERLNARLDKVRALADSMDREAPKPQPGGFIADAIRQALDGCDQ